MMKQDTAAIQLRKFTQEQSLYIALEQNWSQSQVMESLFFFFNFCQKPFFHLDLYYLNAATHLIIKSFHQSDTEAIM